MDTFGEYTLMVIIFIIFVYKLVQNKIGDNQPNECQDRKDKIFNDRFVGQSLANTRQEYENFMQHEIEIYNSSEADLHRHFAKCTTNPGHRDFIPMKYFTMSDLPENHRDEELAQIIKLTSALTVRIGVPFVSTDRPQYYPYSNVSYPLYEYRGKNLNHNGTGHIMVINFKEGEGIDSLGDEYDAYGNLWQSNYKTCICRKCKFSNNPSKEWWWIVVSTATHVVFDSKEAEHVSCRLFYDEDGCDVHTLQDFIGLYQSTERDNSQLRYITCDVHLGWKLYNAQRNISHLKNSVREKYRNRSDDSFVFIVSHPHGCPQYVSFGNIRHVYKVKELTSRLDLVQVTHTAPTCSGSSGASIYSVSLRHKHYHYGKMEPSLNCSTIGIYWK